MLVEDRLQVKSMFAAGEQPLSDAVEMIDAATTAFFGHFDNREGRRPDADQLRAAFLEGASIVKATDGGIEAMSVEGFIGPRVELLSSGSLVDFHEWEEAGRTEVFGAMARRVSRYSKAWVEDGAVSTGRGLKYLSFARVDGAWKIAALVWQDEADGLDVDRVSI